MPDPNRTTISATQSAGLWNVSPYVTRWMLWQHFANGIVIDSAADSRMTWGTKLQPLILEQAAEDLKLEVSPNENYQRRGQLGCTRDADILCPDRGPGALETKCVFDYRTWMADWLGGKSPPRHYEMQLQQQMFVGDHRGSFQWGILAAWVAGEVHYFERKPIPELWDKLQAEAEAFFQSVTDKREPDPFGATIEVEWLVKLLPTEKGKIVHVDDENLAQLAKDYLAAKEQENAGKRVAEPLRAKLLAAARDAEKLILPQMIEVRIGGNEKSKRLSVYVPENLMMAG